MSKLTRFRHIYEMLPGIWIFDADDAWKWGDEGDEDDVWFREVVAWCTERWGRPSSGDDPYGPVRNFWATFESRSIIRVSKPEWVFELKMRFG